MRRLAAIAALTLAACNQPLVSTAPAPGPIGMAASSWTILYSAGMPQHPSPAAAGWFVDLPSCGGDKVDCSLNMIVDGGTRSLSGKLTVAGKIDVTGTPIVNHILGDTTNTCQPLTGGNFRFFIAKGDVGASENRWFAHQTIDLKAGSFDLTVPLTGDQWGGVYGKPGNQDAANFNATLAGSTAVGLVFGGGCFAGHGVNIMNGTMRVTVTDYRMTP